MEKITHHVFKEFKFVKLYLDDLGKIYEILKEDGFNEIKFKTQNFELDFDELKNLDPKEELMEIYSYKPFYFKIDFSYRENVSLYVDRDNSFALGLADRVGKILKSQKRYILNFIINFWFSFIIFFAKRML